ncbi:hypothetical protein M422DRAFT_785735 [Sphaerobolus stellatus SS14]|uniref:Nudix hydrolase domain-containing protein n=1 Tax=Sphaerobolus stellatus (strain SS14) TaxID=990650 RepID=A0A0C9UID8_SPHS4|nr:hypothetical protein M422DRAFT_785735 [Sphaerobolus stellatus SS14]
MATPKTPSIPRVSSSAIIIDHQNRVLMVERNQNSKSFAGAYVFPGGVYDEKQDASNDRITAIRETFEESGVLLAHPSGNALHPSQATLDAARKAIHSQKMSFTSFLSDNGLVPDTDSMFPFTQWITPPSIPRRFHAHFFVTFLPPKVSADSSGDQGLQHLPTPDGGLEVITVRFIKPQDAIAEVQAGKISLMPPQYYLLQTLAPIITGHATTHDQREAVRRLARSGFGGMVINPRPLPYKHEEGYTIMTYEGDETRGGPPGTLHRSLLIPKKGLMHVVRLERNFDIFQGIPLQNATSRL